MLTLTKRDPCWVQLNGAAGRLLGTVRAGVRPRNLRYYDPNTQTWWVHWTWVRWVVDWARRQGWTVDYSALPHSWQMTAAGAQLAHGPAPSQPSPYAELWLLDDAPLSVVKAAYRALATEHHPDAGGSTERFRRVDRAYRQILSQQPEAKS